jgi:type I site-specific restriction-modification system R (restriction) subunit
MADASSSHPTSKPPASSDISSILQQVQSLQGDREKLMRELEAARAEMSHLKQGKREDMKKIFDTVIAKWLEDSVKDEEARKQFAQGMERIVDSTHENGIWTVACAASNLHRTQLEEIERLRVENEGLKSAQTSGFKDEASRKRGRDEAPANPNDFWAGFEVDMGRVQA